MIDCWFSRDVQRILASIHRANTDGVNAADLHTGNTAEYQRGYSDALEAMRVAFGLSREERPSLPTPKEWGL